MKASKLRVVLAADQGWARSTLRHLLSSGSELEIVAEAGDREEAFHLSQEHDPDLILLGIRKGEPPGPGGSWSRADDADPEALPLPAEEQPSVHRPRYAERFAVPRGSRIIMVPVHRIDYVQADGNYARLHVGEQQHLLRRPMQELEECLDPGKFTRIHRSTIINLTRVTMLETGSHGEYLITLTTGTRVRSSRSYRDRVRTRLGLP